MDVEIEAVLKTGPRACFIVAALRAGLIRPGDPLDQIQLDFATEIVTLCARITDRYPDPESPEDTIGDRLRALLYEL